jgi:hypothetical protein
VTDALFGQRLVEWAEEEVEILIPLGHLRWHWQITIRGRVWAQGRGWRTLKPLLAGVEEVAYRCDHVPGYGGIGAGLRSLVAGVTP